MEGGNCQFFLICFQIENFPLGGQTCSATSSVSTGKGQQLFLFAQGIVPVPEVWAPTRCREGQSPHLSGLHLLMNGDTR